tara:strand:+ start:165 stop:548 length:384 start_codon:yes stop_codon:yes gene_type:complete
MIQLWQLKKLSTNEALSEPQKLPENWGPIFGMAGIQDRIGNLSWLGDSYADQGWVVVGESSSSDATSDEASLVWERAKAHLRDSDWTMLSDVPMTAGVKDSWIEYRRALRDIRLQPGFPVVTWPVKS